MSAGIYINFKNESKDAIKFYENVFQTTRESMMLYGELPSDPQHPMDANAKNLVMNASLVIHGMRIMFSDVPEGMGMSYIAGNNISIVIDIADEALLTKTFEQLAAGGTIVMPLDKTFWSEKYGFLIDKFGIGWQFNLSKE